MANHDRIDVGEWVDRRFAELAPTDDWRANTEHALMRLREKDRTRKSRTVKITAIAASTLLALVAALPEARYAPERLWMGSRIVNIGQVFADVKALKDGQTAPDFALQNATGANLRLSAYKGKVVLLNFWATWCHGCTMEIPWLIQFQKSYRDRSRLFCHRRFHGRRWLEIRPTIHAE